MYSGHPLGLFPSSPQAPRLVITNGMVGPGAAGHCPALGWESQVPPTPASSSFPLCAPSPWLPSLFSRSFPTTPPGQSMRSSLPWELQCKSYLTISVYMRVFPPQPCFIVKLCSNIKNNLKNPHNGSTKAQLPVDIFPGGFVDMHTTVFIHLRASEQFGSCFFPTFRYVMNNFK